MNSKSLKTICAWCLVLIRDGQTLDGGRCSHGICPSCSAKLFAEQTARVSELEARR